MRRDAQKPVDGRAADPRKRGDLPLNRPGSKAKPSDAGAPGKRSTGYKRPDVGCELTTWWALSEPCDSWLTGLCGVTKRSEEEEWSLSWSAISAVVLAVSKL